MYLTVLCVVLQNAINKVPFKINIIATICLDCFCIHNYYVLFVMSCDFCLYFLCIGFSLYKYFVDTWLQMSNRFRFVNVYHCDCCSYLTPFLRISLLICLYVRHVFKIYFVTCVIYWLHIHLLWICILQTSCEYININCDCCCSIWLLSILFYLFISISCDLFITVCCDFCAGVESTDRSETVPEERERRTSAQAQSAEASEASSEDSSEEESSDEETSSEESSSEEDSDKADWVQWGHRR